MWALPDKDPTGETAVWVTTYECVFRFGDADKDAYLNYRDGSLRNNYGGEYSECHEAMRQAYMSAVTEHCFTDDKEIAAQYHDAGTLARHISDACTIDQGHISSVSDVFTRMNSEGHMELSLHPSHNTEVCIDMETGEVWAAKDGEKLSDEQIASYQDINQLFEAAFAAQNIENADITLVSVEKNKQGHAEIVLCTEKDSRVRIHVDRAGLFR